MVVAFVQKKCKNEACEKEGKFLCVACNTVKYCSRECQKMHWPTHKEPCKEKKHIETKTSELLNQLDDLDKRIALNAKTPKLKRAQGLAKKDKSVVEEECKELASKFFSAALYYKGNKEYDRAIVYFRQSINLFRRLNGHICKEAGTILHNTGLIFEENKMFEGALELYRESLDINRRLFSETSKEVALTYYNIGLVHAKQNIVDVAIEYYDQAVNIFLEISIDETRDVADIIWKIGALLQETGDFVAAQERFLRSLDIYKSVFGESSMETVSMMNNIATFYQTTKQYDKAIDLLQKCLYLDQDFLKQNPSVLVVSLSNMSSVLRDKGLLDHAKEYMQHSLDFASRAGIHVDNPYANDPPLPPFPLSSSSSSSSSSSLGASASKGNKLEVAGNPFADLRRVEPISERKNIFTIDIGRNSHDRKMAEAAESTKKIKEEGAEDNNKPNETQDQQVDEEKKEASTTMIKEEEEEKNKEEEEEKEKGSPIPRDVEELTVEGLSLSPSKSPVSHGFDSIPTKFYFDACRPDPPTLTSPLISSTSTAAVIDQVLSQAQDLN